MFSSEHAGMFRFQPGLGKGQYLWGGVYSCSPTSLQGPFTAYLTPSVLYREALCSSPTLKCCSEGDILFLLTLEENSLL